MKEIIVDLRKVDLEIPGTFADLPERAEIDSALMDLVGEVATVRIVRYLPHKRPTREVKEGMKHG
jgi:hypothetical protein